MTSKPTDAQLLALARIKSWGVEVSGGDPESPMATAFLCSPHFTSVQIKITTLRALIRRGWVEQLPAESDELGRDCIWGVTADGVGLLNKHTSFLEEAGREASSMAGRAELLELQLEQKRAAAAE